MPISPRSTRCRAWIEDFGEFQASAWQRGVYARDLWRTRQKRWRFSFTLKIDTLHSNEEVLPVIWEDNYISLLPGEKREVAATYADLPPGESPVVQMDGWNLEP